MNVQGICDSSKYIEDRLRIIKEFKVIHCIHLLFFILLFILIFLKSL